jgi:hypothetical protein
MYLTLTWRRFCIERLRDHEAVDFPAFVTQPCEYATTPFKAVISHWNGSTWK